MPALQNWMQPLLVSWRFVQTTTVRSSEITSASGFAHTRNIEQYLQTPVQLEHACSILLHSELFTFHSERMRERLLDDAEKVPTHAVPALNYV